MCTPLRLGVPHREHYLVMIAAHTIVRAHMDNETDTQGLCLILGGVQHTINQALKLI